MAAFSPSFLFASVIRSSASRPDLRERRAATKHRGFALLITITLVAFLVLILVGLASFTRVETQVATNTQQMAQARQNALMALNVAIGELQRTAGPDQRVTATAELLTTTHETKRKWTGVWNATDGTRLSWLVSGDAPNPASAAPTLAAGVNVDSANVRLVGDKSTDISVAGNGIIVPLQDILADQVPGLSGNQTVGKFGYWVSDEGVKAKVNLRDAYVAGTAPGSDYRLLSAPRLGIERVDNDNIAGNASLFPDFYAINSNGVDKLISAEQFPLLSETPYAGGSMAAEQVAMRDALKTRFHDLGFVSMGVISDVKNGGLKLDLSSGLLDTKFDIGTNNFLSYLQSNGIATGTEGTAATRTQLFDQQVAAVANAGDLGGPRWKQLSAFYNTTLTGGVANHRIQTNDDGGLMPVITHYSIAFKPFLSGGTTQLYFFPTVVLWNPYNIPMRLTDRLVLEAQNMGFNGNQFTISVPATASNVTWTQGVNPGASTTPPSLTATHNNTGFNYMRIEVPAVTLQPGERAVFRASQTNHQTLASVNSTMRLVKDGVSGYGYYLNYAFPQMTYQTGTPAVTTTVSVLPYISNNVNLLGYSPAWYASQGYTLPGGGRVYCYQHTQLGAYDARANHTITTTLPAPPGNTVALDFTNAAQRPVGGYRINMAFQQGLTGSSRYITNSFNKPFFSHYNPRASFSNRTVFDRDLNTPQSYQTNPAYNSGWSDPNSTNENGAYLPGVDALTVSEDGTLFGIDRAVLYEVPVSSDKFHSITQLGGANLIGPTLNANNVPASSYFVGSFTPSFAVGNSDADPRIPDNATSFPWTGTSQANNVAHYDYSYLLNEALYDRFFFSTIDSRGKSAADPVPFPLPNARVIAYESNTSTASALRDYSQAAGHLLINGAFNINSLSVEAWRAVLASMRDIPVSPGASSAVQRNPYVRSANPLAQSFNRSGMDYEDAEAYSGYRSLTDAEIDALATRLVSALRARIVAKGRPFTSLAEFINRDPTSSNAAYRIKGVMQEAIDTVTSSDNLINDAFSSSVTGTVGTAPTSYPGPNEVKYNVPTARGAPGFLMQADLLRKLDSTLSVRSDTFIVRAYGSALNPVTNEPAGQAWLEAVVQRTPELVDSSQTPETRPANFTSTNQAFGRRFKVVSFRWLSPDDL